MDFDFRSVLQRTEIGLCIIRVKKIGGCVQIRPSSISIIKKKDFSIRIIFEKMKKILLLGSGELGKEFVISAQRKGQHVIACDSYEGAPAM